MIKSTLCVHTDSKYKCQKVMGASLMNIAIRYVMFFYQILIDEHVTSVPLDM